jgi:hypothetical protein
MLKYLCSMCTPIDLHYLYKIFFLIISCFTVTLVFSIMEPIRLSALGRDVNVGDLYNYFNDNILPGKIYV